MKNTSILIMCLFFSSIIYGQPPPCQTEINREFLKTELKSLTEIYKSVLADCNSENPVTGKAECENDLTSIKRNIEQLTALNSLIETLGCNYSIYRDDKPCINAKYCQFYKIEDRSSVSDTAGKTPEEIKAFYDIELKKIKAQNRQQFFEVVYKIIGFLVEGSNGQGLLAEIKKLVTGEKTAKSLYAFPEGDLTAIDQDNDNEIEGFKKVNKNGSMNFSIDTDSDGKIDQEITYDTNGKMVSEKMVSDNNVANPFAKSAGKTTSTNTKTAINKIKKEFIYYADCITTLNAKGKHDRAGGPEEVIPSKKPAHEYLFLVAATIKDNGESNINATSPTADIGLSIYKNAEAKNALYRGRLLGPYYEGKDNDQSAKYEWMNYCSMRYNRFVLLDVTDCKYKTIRIVAQEGDDAEWIQGKDDVVFDAFVSLDAIRKGDYKVTGNCDIRGKCATLYFVIDSMGSNASFGSFWNNNEQSSVRPKPNIVYSFFVAGEETVKHILKKGLSYLDLSHQWAVIRYADGYCLFNHFKSKRTYQDLIDHATGKGDCDWWPWPEGSKHACLNSAAIAAKIAKAHGGIKDIEWIDHPTKKCGN